MPDVLMNQPGAELHAPRRAGRIGPLLHRIADDVRVIARDEVEIARGALEHNVKSASIDAAAIVIGAIVALIGLGFACTAAAVGLAHALPLWLSLLIFAVRLHRARRRRRRAAPPASSRAPRSRTCACPSTRPRARCAG